ncbi:hypothetical protein [Nocardia sp. NPDC052316]|uniref:hypothetical protein n=1 Tax=Nocardia sp. NPDC052316 TaxID=3364329 RepID=UPI0037C5964B
MTDGTQRRTPGQTFATPPLDAARFAKYPPMAYGAWTDRSGTTTPAVPGLPHSRSRGAKVPT